MRKPSESYAKELLGLGVTVPVSLFGDEHAAAEGPHDMSRECRSVSAVISGPLSGLGSGPSLLNTLKSREILRELQFVLAM